MQTLDGELAEEPGQIMKIRSKIFSGCLLISLFFALVILLFLYTIRPIERHFDQLADEHLPRLNLIHSISTQGSLLLSETHEIGYLLSLYSASKARDESSIENIEGLLFNEIEEISNTRQKLQSNVQSYRQLVELSYAADDSYVPLLAPLAQRLVELSSEVEKMLIEQDYSMLPLLIKKEELEGVEEQFVSVVAMIVDYEVKMINSHEDRLHLAVSTAHRWLPLSFLFALLLALLSGVYLARHIERQVDSRG